MSDARPAEFGRYQLQDVLSVGTFGKVYRARDTNLDRLVAIEVLEPLDSVERTSRLRSELSSAGGLSHQHIVPMYDFGDHAGSPYIVMEYELGDDLRAWMDRQPALSLFDKVRIMQQVGEGLAYAHEQGVIHGGIRPANILWRPDGVAKILNFGIASAYARRLLPEDCRYLAPEELTGHAADTLCDIFSYGAVCYELFAGKSPFEGTDRLRELAGAIRDEGVPLNVVVPDCPPALSQLVMRAIAADRDVRFQTVMDLLLDLRPVLLELLRQQAAVLIRSGDYSQAQAAILNVLSPPPPAGQLLDQDVQFTVYRPVSVPPLKWRTLLAFAHRAQRPPDAPDEEPDPVVEVERQAEAILGERFADYEDFKQDSTQPVQRGGEISFVPYVDGLEFNPPRRSFRWMQSVHREEFQFRAAERLNGQVARGRLSVFLGSIVVAEVALRIEVAAQASPRPRRPLHKETARIYCNVFASYSHLDTAVVREFQRYAAARGDKYLMDVANLTPGEPWGKGLRNLIDHAHVFQLFWSRNSMKSEVVREEYQYALSLPRERFVCPVYWEEPMPQEPERGLPPEELRRIHFQRIYPASVPGSEAPGTPGPPPTGAFTRLFWSAGTSQPDGAAGSQPPATPSTEPGEFTRMFQAPPASAPPPPRQGPSEYTRMIDRGAPSGAPPPPAKQMPGMSPMAAPTVPCPPQSPIPQVAAPPVAVPPVSAPSGKSSNNLLIVIFCLLTFLAGGILVYLLVGRW